MPLMYYFVKANKIQTYRKKKKKIAVKLHKHDLEVGK